MRKNIANVISAFQAGRLAFLEDGVIVAAEIVTLKSGERFVSWELPPKG